MYLMALLYVAAGINHFWHPKFYIRIMPPYLPAPLALNYLSGAIEIALGLLLCIKPFQKAAALGIAILLVLFISVHIYMLQASLKSHPYAVPVSLAIARLALQPLLILWALWYYYE